MDRKHLSKIDWTPYIMLLPAGILLAIITAYPFFTSISLSLFDYSFLKQGMRFIGLKNYIDIIQEGKFLSSVGFTLEWTLINVVVMTLLGLGVALLLRVPFFGKGFIKAIMLIPWILPQVVTGYTFSLMFTQEIGVVNYLLESLGIPLSGFTWFGTVGPATAVVLIANIWRGFPFLALMIYAKMQTLPSSWEEAARIDGANAWQRLRYILLPYTRPVLQSCMLLTFLWSFNAFDIIKVMTNGGPLEKTMTLSLRLQREAFSYLEISRACTMAVIMFGILLACVGAIILIHFILSGLLQRQAGNRR